MLQFDSVSLQYKNYAPPILNQVSFRMEQGDSRYLTGRNGVGKSSLLSLLYMATAPSQGEIRLFGQSISRCPRPQRQSLRRKMGILFQEPQLIEHVNVFDNVALPLRLAHVSEQNIQNSVMELLKWLELDHKAYDMPGTLSGGERQCIALGRSVIHRPQFIIADEPTAHIDHYSSEKILRLLYELNKLGTSLIIATHDPWILENYPAIQLHLHEGQIKEIAPPSYIETPINPHDIMAPAA